MIAASSRVLRCLSLVRTLTSVKVARAMGRRPAGPLFAFIEVNKACNNRCVYCSIWKTPPSETRGLPKEVLFGALKDLAAGGCLFADLFGGEPLLRADLPELCAHASALGMNVTVTTNGRLLDKSVFEKLACSGVNQILITIAGSTPQTHDRMVGVGGAFDQVLSAVSQIRECAGRDRVLVGFNAFVSALNFRELPSMVRMARSCDVTWIRFLPFNASFPFDHCGLGLDRLAFEPDTLGAFREKFSEAIDLTRRYGMLTNSPIFLEGVYDHFNPEHGTSYTCYAGYLFCDIGSDGTVYRCFPAKEPMGSLLEDTFSAVWRSRRAIEACAPKVLPRCRSCWQSCYVESSVRICLRFLPRMIPLLLQESRLFLLRD